jgi:hypothetical protein
MVYRIEGATENSKGESFAINRMRYVILKKDKGMWSTVRCSKTRPNLDGELGSHWPGFTGKRRAWI